MKKLLLTGILIISLISCSAPSPEVQPSSTPKPSSTSTPSPKPPTVTPTLTSTNTPLPAENVEFYHLRFEYTVTSDWATLEFLNPEVFAWTKQVEVTGNPQSAIFSSNMLDVYRPLKDIGKNPKATIVFDAAILPGQIGAPLDVKSMHGALKGSGLKVWNIDDNNEQTLLQEINHFWVDQNNPDNSQAKFTVDLSLLAGTPPLQRTVEQTGVERLVWAIYYPWYMPRFAPRWWSSDIWVDRPIEPYSSDDIEGLRAHIAAAQSAGIDGFLVEWCGIQYKGDADVMDANFGKMLDLAEEMNFKMAAYYDLLCTQGVNPADLQYLLTVRAAHPAYYHMNGLPVVAMYNTESTDPAAWQDILDEAGSKGLNAVFIGDSYDPARFSLFDGLHQYVNFGEPDISGRYHTLERGALFTSVFGPDGRSHFWAATVTPGFDNTPIYNGRSALNPGMQKGDILTLDRAGGQTYRDAWDLALHSGAEWVIITSWNEWQENTHIEPSQMYGDYYLQLTREYISKWKNQ